MYLSVQLLWPRKNGAGSDQLFAPWCLLFCQNTQYRLCSRAIAFFRADLVPADQKSFVSARPIPVPLVD